VAALQSEAAAAAAAAALRPGSSSDLQLAVGMPRLKFPLSFVEGLLSGRQTATARSTRLDPSTGSIEAGQWVIAEASAAATAAWMAIHEQRSTKAAALAMSQAEALDTEMKAAVLKEHTGRARSRHEQAVARAGFDDQVSEGWVLACRLCGIVLRNVAVDPHARISASETPSPCMLLLAAGLLAVHQALRLLRDGPSCSLGGATGGALHATASAASALQAAAIADADARAARSGSHRAALKVPIYSHSAALKVHVDTM
jgi:hypothetical protein